MRRSASESDCDVPDIDQLLDDVSLLSDETKRKIRQVRQSLCDVKTLRAMIVAQEKRAQGDMDRLLADLRDIRDQRRKGREET